MPTIAFRLAIEESLHDEAIGFLDDPIIEGFFQEPNQLTIYINESDSDAGQRWIQSVAEQQGYGAVESSRIDDRNWNEEWEASIQPVIAGRFVIRPTWSEAIGGDLQEILIDPKMSFGTGHHESTRLLLSRTHDMVKPDDQVLDAGTGTGVLGIAALLLGASQVDAFDIDPVCMENASENAELNGVAKAFDVKEGDERVIPQTGYDLIFANINREALRGMLPTLASHLATDGRMGLAGLLRTDEPIMRESISAAGLQVLEHSHEGEWWSVWVVPVSEASSGTV